LQAEDIQAAACVFRLCWNENEPETGRQLGVVQEVRESTGAILESAI
jgi:hypothetical protein